MPLCGKSGMSRIQSSRRIDSGADDIGCVLLYWQIFFPVKPYAVYRSVCQHARIFTGTFGTTGKTRPARAASCLSYRKYLFDRHRLHLRGAVGAACCLTRNGAETVGALACRGRRWHLFWLEACHQVVDGQHDEIIDHEGHDEKADDRVDEIADVERFVSPGNDNSPGRETTTGSRDEWGNHVGDE